MSFATLIRPVRNITNRRMPAQNMMIMKRTISSFLNGYYSLPRLASTSLPLSYTEPGIVFFGLLGFGLGMTLKAIIDYEDPHIKGHTMPTTTWGDDPYMHQSEQQQEQQQQQPEQQSLKTTTKIQPTPQPSKK